MQRRGSWLIPMNAAIFFAVLCFWSIQKHDTLWAMFEMLLCLVNAYIAVYWLRAKRMRKQKP